ncbi:MAG: penicillin-binding transpeptidase domain-containing protein, partial [Dehalococcoidia bacterium]
VAIDPKTAETIVYVGSRDYFREDIDGQNDMANALNSPGSSFKPFTYLTAFMNLGWGPGTMILDTPFPLEYWDGENPPRNPGTGFQGPISVRNSLGNSLNIPAVKTIMYAGVPTVVDQATKMGITGLDASRLGPSMTIGGVDVKLNDMVYAYTAFPNLGILKGVESTVPRPAGNRTLDPVSILRVEDREGNVLYPIVDGEPSPDGPQLQEARVAPAEQTYMISNILSDGSAQCIVFGCGGLGIGRPLAVKTGTSEPYETIGAIGDTWAIGYTPQLVVGSWFGNADNSPMTGITSTSVSWRAVRDLQVAYHEELPVESFTRPAGLVEGQVCIPSGLKADKDCAVKSQRDLLASDSLPGQDDSWWTVAEIDTRTGKLASALTPERFVEERFYLALPEGLGSWPRNQALEWARELESASAEEPPTESTDASDLPSAIISPASAAQLQGPVPVSGRAGSQDFVAFRLEYRYDTEPGDWVLIIRRDIQVAEGILAVWDTTGLPFGLYTLRLVVEDEELGEQEDRVQVLLIGTATVAPTPTVLPEQIE